MEQHEIIPTTFQRAGTHMELISHKDGWILRDINGLCYFWHPSQAVWVLTSRIGSDFTPYYVIKEEGLKLLASVQHAS